MISCGAQIVRNTKEEKGKRKDTNRKGRSQMTPIC